VGLEPFGPHPLGNNNQFHPALRDSQGFGFILAQELFGYKAGAFIDARKNRPCNQRPIKQPKSSFKNQPPDVKDRPPPFGGNQNQILPTLPLSFF
jgi:hypothetical protein